MNAWSSDLYEVTWFFFKSHYWHWLQVKTRKRYAENQKNSKYHTCWVKIGYWGIHVSYASE